ncbi:MAG TPA: radical SAM protein [Elusimicrobiota bacterium]|nr:radical SAM protein [Elusimicrobiota bacterium]
MKVALVQAPVWWTVDPPLGLAQMAGCALQYGHEVHVFDLNIQLWKQRPPQYQNMWLWEQFHLWNNPEVIKNYFETNRAVIEDYVQQILRTGVRVIGFSVALGSHLASCELARMIKKEDPKRLIVMGGQYFFRNQDYRDFVRQNGVDIVIRGAADNMFPKVLSLIELDRGLEFIPGLVFRKGKYVVDTGAPTPIRDLDITPFADFTRFPMDLYEDQNRIPISASRGCIWSCRYCSTWTFWPSYAYMSGNRIYSEILYHRRFFPKRFHIEFYDITANGKPETLSRFSDLVIENELRSGWKHFRWKINAVIRPDMTAELLQKMAKANCQDIIYGIESGSPKVLKLMHKLYKIEVAERVLKDTHNAGIKSVANFMFGFPGETEQDFQMTLDFLNRNYRHLDRVYASASFTSLEEFSYLTEHQEDFGIQKTADKKHNLYWRTKDGTNNYLVRLDRFKRFRELASRLGVDAYKGLDGAIELDHTLNTAQYHLHSDQPFTSLRWYLKYLHQDSQNSFVRKQSDVFAGPLRSLRPILRLLLKANEALDQNPLTAEEKRLFGEWRQTEEHEVLRRMSKNLGKKRMSAAMRGAFQALYRAKKIGFYRVDVELDPAARFQPLWGKDVLTPMPDALATIDRYFQDRTPSPAETPKGVPAL